jgi:Ca2+-transporting ATPase
LEAYKEDIDALLRKFDTDPVAGLTEQAILVSRERSGSNEIVETNRGAALGILFRQFKSPLIAILLVAALASFYLQSSRDGLILLVIIVINALIGFYQEWRSETILGSIRKLVVEKCKVIRGGKQVEIFSRDVVPGDLVMLEEGVGVPADIRLIESENFAVNEFILTGESLPSSKDHQFKTSETVPLAAMKNTVFMGTTVARGEALGIVYATGMETEIGKISSTSGKIKSPDAPIQIEVKDIARKLTIGTLIIGLVLFITRIIMQDTVSVALVFAIGVAAAMVPEGLPAQISMSLALAVARLARKNAIVKKIASAQTLGSATVIASDKTGTITKNEMTITGCHFNGSSFSVSGRGYLPKGEIMDEKGKILNRETLGDLKVFFLSGYLSSTGKVNPPDSYHPGWYSIGDPTESAFATLAMKAGYSLEEINKNYPVLQSFSFDSYRKRASIVRQHKGKVICFVKGSLESVLQASCRIIINGKEEDLTDERRQEIKSRSLIFAEQALRIIAIAYRDLDSSELVALENAESNLVYAGFVTMYDPPHEQVKDAIHSVFAAQIKVCMITGDNEVTAKAVAQQIGLMNEGNQFPEVINSERLQSMSDEEVYACFSKPALIFSRVSPNDKFRIVDLLEKNGEIVAVTGDGVNDTLSLKRADIGVAMGLNGSKVAQDAATIILLDDNFSTIVVAVKEGRTIFRNLEKTIKTNLSSNIAELFCVLAGFAGVAAGIAMPILAVQILLIDMIGEMFPLIMLTYDLPEKKIMEMPPRDPKEKILTRENIYGILFNGTLMGLASFLAFLATYLPGRELPQIHEQAMTVTFVSVILCQYANLLSRRSYEPVFSRYLISNKLLLGAFCISFALTLLVVYVPDFNIYFHTYPLSISDWFYPLIASAICLFIYELRKARSRATHKL